MEWEEDILSSLSHENIARIFYPLRLAGKNCVLTMEFIGKNIKDLIPNLNDMEKKVIMYQLACAVSYLQEKRIAHLGLSPNNVYVLEHSGNFIVKLINFQNALRFDNDCEALEFDYNIDGFSAPEVIQEFSEKIAYISSDIYSLGCLFFYIVSGGFKMIQIKYSDQFYKVDARLKMIKDDETFKILFKDLIQKMLVFEHDKRICHHQVKNHPCFWTSKNVTEYFIDTGILIEKDSDYFDFLTKNGKDIIDSDWTKKLEGIVLKVIREIRQKTMKSPSNQDNCYVESAGYLVKIIRNSLVHPTDERVVDIMGTTKEDLMNYWNKKFPNLICFMYNSKLEYDYLCKVHFS